MKSLGIVAVVVLLAGGVWLASTPEESDNTSLVAPEAVVEDKMAAQEIVVQDAPEVEPAMQEKIGDEAVIEKQSGAYLDYSADRVAESTGDTVLFFMASWCPSCRTLDKNIKASVSDIPAGVTILKVDYDSHTDLRQQYGVTYQHTLVQVDAQGNLIKKWSGGNSVDSITDKL